MNKKKAPRLTALCAAFTLSCSPAFAVETTLPIPSPSVFADTESATNIPFAGWNDLTRFINISAEVFASLASCVQVAFGTDHNDGDLTIDETDLVLGYDCGTWFIRDEKNGGEAHSGGEALLPRHNMDETSSSRRDRSVASPLIGSITTQPTTNSQQRATFDVSRLFSRDWNLMKITTRGEQTLAPTLGLEFKNNPFVFILK